MFIHSCRIPVHPSPRVSVAQWGSVWGVGDPGFLCGSELYSRAVLERDRPTVWRYLLETALEQRWDPSQPQPLPTEHIHLVSSTGGHNTLPDHMYTLICRLSLQIRIYSWLICISVQPITIQRSPFYFFSGRTPSQSQMIVSSVLEVQVREQADFGLYSCEVRNTSADFSLQNTGKKPVGFVDCTLYCIRYVVKGNLH